MLPLKNKDDKISCVRYDKEKIFIIKPSVKLCVNVIYLHTKSKYKYAIKSISEVIDLSNQQEDIIISFTNISYDIKFIKDVCHNANFKHIEEYNETTLHYLYNIMTFNFDELTQDDSQLKELNFWLKHLSINPYYKGNITEYSLAHILFRNQKLTDDHLEYSGLYHHLGDFYTNSMIIEIKNWKDHNNDQIYKVCYDLCFHLLTYGEYKFCLYTHFYDNQKFYYFQVNNGKLLYIKANSFDSSLISLPIIGIPFVKYLSTINDIIDYVKNNLPSLCNSKTFISVITLAEKHNDEENDIVISAIKTINSLKNENEELHKKLSLIPYLQQKLTEVADCVRYYKSENEELHKKLSLMSHLKQKLTEAADRVRYYKSKNEELKKERTELKKENRHKDSKIKKLTSLLSTIKDKLIS